MDFEFSFWLKVFVGFRFFKCKGAKAQGRKDFFGSPVLRKCFASNGYWHQEEKDQQLAINCFASSRPCTFAF